MAEFQLALPGYAALPTRGGPDVFDNISGLAWTDQLGLRSGTDVAYNGRSGQSRFDFHFPFTTPIIFGPGNTMIQSGHIHPSPIQKMTIQAVFVTFRTDTAVRVDRIRVFDRLALIFDTLPTLGLLGLSSSVAWNNTTVAGQNLHFFTRLVDKSIGVTVTVNFGTGGIIRFTGAGIRLTSP